MRSDRAGRRVPTADPTRLRAGAGAGEQRERTRLVLTAGVVRAARRRRGHDTARRKLMHAAVPVKRVPGATGVINDDVTRDVPVPRRLCDLWRHRVVAGGERMQYAEPVEHVTP